MNAVPREPFDAEEAELARIYGALPGGEPSPALDARILAQARSAVAGSRRRRRPWFLGAGFGTAAAAVMAAGIAWQLGVFSGSSHDATAPSVTTPARAPAAAPPLREERIEVETFRQEARRDEPPATDAALLAKESPDATRELKRRAAPRPAAAPPPPPAPAVAAPEPFPMQPQATPEPERARTLDAVSEKSEAPQAASAFGDGAGRADTDDREADARATARSGMRLGSSAALPPWTTDAELEPQPWLERIRERVKKGDRAGAEQSLRNFVLQHPERRVPRDLQRLLVE